MLAAKNKILQLDLGLRGIACAYTAIDDKFDSISRAEQEVVAKAVTKRVREYSTGRWLARRILSEFETTAHDLLPGPNREPVWPQHLVGSITHTDTHAAVAVASKSAWVSLGIDMQDMQSVSSDLVSRVLTDHERRTYSKIDASLIFCAKEACYKYLFPLVGEFVDYLSVEVVINLERDSFQLKYRGDSPANRIADHASGKLLKLDNCWFCVVYASAAEY